MICAPLTSWRKYAGMGPAFVQAAGFLEQAVASPGAFAPGRHPIVGDDIHATLSALLARAPDSVDYEWHERMADIHVCLEGEEWLGWRPDGNGLQVTKPFDPVRDFGLCRGPVQRPYRLEPGCFAVFLPGEPHAPALGTGSLLKWVAKFPFPAP